MYEYLQSIPLLDILIACDYADEILSDMNDMTCMHGIFNEKEIALAKRLDSKMYDSRQRRCVDDYSLYRYGVWPIFPRNKLIRLCNFLNVIGVGQTNFIDLIRKVHA